MNKKAKFWRLFSLTMLVTGVVILTTGIVHAQDNGESVTDLAQAFKSINTMWVLIAGFLVFFMQAGFGFLEAGFVRSKNVVNIMAENFLDTTMTTTTIYLSGDLIDKETVRFLDETGAQPGGQALAAVAVQDPAPVVHAAVEEADELAEPARVRVVPAVVQTVMPLPHHPCGVTSGFKMVSYNHFP